MAVQALSLCEGLMDVGRLFGVNHLPVTHPADLNHRPPQLSRILFIREIMAGPTLPLLERGVTVGRFRDRCRAQHTPSLGYRRLGLLGDGCGRQFLGRSSRRWHRCGRQFLRRDRCRWRRGCISIDQTTACQRENE